MTNQIYFDGKKSIELSQYPAEAWEWLTGEPDDGKTGIKEYFKAVPWLFRGVTMRADAVASMPFSIYSGENEVDNSKDYQNVVGWLPNPKHTFKLMEMSATLLGSAYLFNVRNNVVTLDLKYLNPLTMKPIIDEKEGLTGFKRTLTRTVVYQVEDIIYFWLEDPYVEIGEPETSPAKAALMASGVLANVDEFVAAFFKRGAIKATILGVPVGTPEGAKTELQTWWNKAISGINNAFAAKVINADAIEATTIGEGVDELQDTDLTDEKREDIATALGVPQTILFSNAANYATAKQDDLHFYDKTIVPECNFFQYALNEQMFEPAGYRLQFTPEVLDIFQEDENERAQAFAHLAPHLPVDVVLRILGFELADEDWTAIEAEKEAKEERAQAFAQNTPAPPQFGNADTRSLVADPLQDHLDKWRRKAQKRIKNGRGGVVPFDSDIISPTLNAAISGALEEAKTEDDVVNIFASSWLGYP